MTMFSVSVFMKIGSKTDIEPLWEERILLVKAESEDDATRKAETYAKSEEHSYSSTQGKKTDVQFDSVDRVYSIEDALEDGAELFSRFLRDSEIKSLKTPFED